MVIAWDTFLLSVADTDAQWRCGGREREDGLRGQPKPEWGTPRRGQAVISGILKRILRRSSSSIQGDLGHGNGHGHGHGQFIAVVDCDSD